MIRAIVDFALNKRLLVLAFALLLFVCGIVAFHHLPVEAYPDVANNYAWVITQWPGRAAEEVEQQVTIPLETAMNGIPRLTHLRSVSIAGLSVVILIFDDDSDNAWNRQKVLERISMVNSAREPSAPDRSRFQPRRPDLLLYLEEHEPGLRRHGAEIPPGLGAREAVQDGPQRGRRVELRRSHAGVPGARRPGKARLLRPQHRPGGAAARQQQRERGRQLHRGGHAADQRARRRACCVRRPDIEKTVITTKNGTPVRVKDIAVVSQGPKIRLGQFGRAIHREDGKIIDNDDVVSGIVLMRKGADFDSALEGVHKKVEELNDHILPPGVKVVPFNDRGDLVHYTTPHGPAQPHGGPHPRHGRAPPLSREHQGRPHRRADHPLFAALRVDLPRPAAYTGEPAVARRPRLRHGRRRDGRDGGEHHPPPGPQGPGIIRDGQDQGRLPRGAEARLLRHCNHHQRLSAHLHPPARGRTPVQAHGLDRGVCAARRHDILHHHRTGPGQLSYSGRKHPSGTTR